MRKLIIILCSLLLMMACQMEGEQHYELKRESLTKKAVPKKVPPSSSKLNDKGAKGAKIQFVNKDFEQVLSQAKEENKLIFMDAYTDWCYPCKKMDKRVFTNKEAASFYNDNFINYKLNVKGAANKKLARRYGVRAYPTLVYINGKGEQLGSSIGYIDAKQLIGFGKEILQDFGGK